MAEWGGRVRVHRICCHVASRRILGLGPSELPGATNPRVGVAPVHAPRPHGAPSPLTSVRLLDLRVLHGFAGALLDPPELRVPDLAVALAERLEGGPPVDRSCGSRALQAADAVEPRSPRGAVRYLGRLRCRR